MYLSVDTPQDLIDVEVIWRKMTGDKTPLPRKRTKKLIGLFKMLRFYVIGEGCYHYLELHFFSFNRFYYIYCKKIYPFITFRRGQ